MKTMMDLMLTPDKGNKSFATFVKRFTYGHGLSNTPNGMSTGGLAPCGAVGIVFSEPNNSIVQEQILKQMDIYNYMSGKNIDFYFVGYSKEPNSHLTNQYKISFEDSVWYFSANDFVEFIQQMRLCTKWRYRGEPELLLLEYDSKGLDWKNVISINLSKALKSGAIFSIRELFSDIFYIAQNCAEASPMRNKILIKGVLKEHILKYLNEKTHGVAGIYDFFRLHDLSIEKK